ncbi:hypothetical protein V6N13_123175 [Hibiscus sabdariffa]
MFSQSKLETKILSRRKLVLRDWRETGDWFPWKARTLKLSPVKGGKLEIGSNGKQNLKIFSRKRQETGDLFPWKARTLKLSPIKGGRLEIGSHGKLEP